ncbi:ion transporter [Arcobacter sp. FWKO B]|uniref:ion transporter n=1 Tax=Arcobacter sp. FWKO B TaxID=2593672 RepID=UPI0018A410AE|nr:ion transporter [Arcobacter sp. FWKO B]QOG13086.1 ion transporter [Arcobacter sp. FWKO B]
MYDKIKNIVDSKKFQNFIIALIVFNGITMGMETSKDIMSSAIGIFINISTILVISIFVVEIAMRIYVYRGTFFKDPWSLFDFFVVAISLIPASAGFEVLRILRVLRLFRLVTAVPQMRKIVMALVSVVPGMLSIAAILSIFFYVFAIMSTHLFGESFPEWFGTLGASLYTLFQVMTLESWSMGIVRPIMEVYPSAWVFFIIFIFVATFVMINLIVAVIVDAMGQLKKDEEAHIIDEIHQTSEISNKELIELKNELTQIKKLLQK